MNIERKFSSGKDFHKFTRRNATDQEPTPQAPLRPGSRRPDYRAVSIRAGRAMAERLLALAPHLQPAERAVIEQIFADGRTAAEVGRLTGRTPRAIRAQVAQLAMRMSDPLFRWVAVHEESLPRELRAVARGCILHGRPMAEVALEEGVTYHQARAMRQAIVALARARIVSRLSARDVQPAIGGEDVPAGEAGAVSGEAGAGTAACSRRGRPRAAWRDGQRQRPDAGGVNNNTFEGEAS